jgi:hypothetical protein
MSSASHERREFQRIAVAPALSASFGPLPVTLVELGILGARVESASPLEDAAGDLRFSFRDGNVALRCAVARTRTLHENDGDRYEAGLRFVAALDDSGDLLREMLGVLVSRALEDRRMLVPRDPLGALIDGDRPVRAADAGYLSYRLVAGVWQRKRIFLPEQPESGFTVARDEDSEEMQRLCRIYQASDDEGRRLIRMFAELSATMKIDLPIAAS